MANPFLIIKSTAMDSTMNDKTSDAVDWTGIPFPKTTKTKKKPKPLKRTSLSARKKTIKRSTVKSSPKKPVAKKTRTKAKAKEGSSKALVLRQFAKGQECTLRLPSICNFDSETVVLCHVKPAGFGMMAGKPNDLHGVHACSACHQFIDGIYVTTDWSREAVEAELFRALYETQCRVIRAGLVTSGELLANRIES